MARRRSWDDALVQARARVEMVMHRAESLAPEDRELLRVLVAEGKSSRETAVLLGMPVRRLRRRTSALVSRVLSPAFVYVLRHRGSMPSTWRRVADACFLRGCTVKEASAELGMSEYSVRRHRVAIQALIDQEAREEAAVALRGVAA